MNLDDILAKLTALPEAEQQKIIKDAQSATKNMPWVPNPGPQSDAFFSGADELFYGGQAGGGKGFRKSQRVLTPFGWKAVGALKAGDALCATDGTVQKVIAVHQRGVQPLYKLTWHDGTETVCDEDHIWLGWDSGATRKQANVKTIGEASARKWNTKELFERFQNGTNRRFGIPTISAPVRFTVQGEAAGRGKHIGRIIPPYVLGVLLGDGCLTKSTVEFTSADGEIPARVEQELGVLLTSSRAKGLARPYRIPFHTGVGAALEDLKLRGKYSHEKFIPRIYLLATVEARWALLQGLMDTDGCAEEDGDCYYTTVSLQLAGDVAHLARSLGAIVTRREKVPSFTYKGESREGQLAYTLRIKMPKGERMFHLSRKAERVEGREVQSMALWLNSIVPCSEDETVCITVSHPNSLFITEGFVVTHNSDLEIGLSLTEHKRALLLRRTNKEALGLVDRMAEILGSRDGWSSQAGSWRYNEKVVDIGGCQLEEDKQKYKGTPHDLICFDEVSDFTETQYRFITTWNRSADPKQRCRVVCAGNPPTRPEGLWVIKHWAPWLDPAHPKPAQPGELRWYTTIGGKDVEVEGPGPHDIPGEPEPVRARSRTFIPAKLSDNPDLASTNYASVLAALPEELRAAYRDGRFDVSLRDDAFQAIPTAWIREAQERWRINPPLGIPMCCIGVDVAQGGNDRTVLAIRYDGWYAPLIAVPGASTPDGKTVAGLVVQHRRNDAKVIVDIGGGWGGDAYAHLRENGVDAKSYMGVKPSVKRTVDGQLKFFNTRTEAYWRFREALDPSQPQGSPIALPNDAELVADLCAPTYEVGPNGIKIEAKDKVCDRIGRSTDKGDAIVMAWWDGIKQANTPGGWNASAGRKPQVVMGRKAGR